MTTSVFDVMKENEADGDLGSGGPMVLPDIKDESGRIRQLVIGGGKDRNIYFADRDAMGKFDAQGNRGLYQELPQALKHGFTRPRPAYFDGEVYYGGTGDPLVAFRFEMRGYSPNLRRRPPHLSVIPESHRAFPRTAPEMESSGSSKIRISIMRRDLTTPFFTLSMRIIYRTNSTTAIRLRMDVIISEQITNSSHL